ncbi:MAG: hypothetical protein LBF22_02715 [Deltaproteobacteria bacterium]|jgi:hypothetical protein|nr:hypothetical protein [Deltaproteobacteria bacterium]
MADDKRENRYISQRYSSLFMCSRWYANSKDTKGKQYPTLPKIYLITFCDFSIDPSYVDDLLLTATFVDNSNNNFCDAINLALFEVSKAERILKKKGIKNLTAIEAIAVFIKFSGNSSKIEMIDQLVKKFPQLSNAYKIFKKSILLHRGGF